MCVCGDMARALQTLPPMTAAYKSDIVSESDDNVQAKNATQEQDVEQSTNWWQCKFKTVSDDRGRLNDLQELTCNPVVVDGDNASNNDTDITQSKTITSHIKQALLVLFEEVNNFSKRRQLIPERRMQLTELKTKLNDLIQSDNVVNLYSLDNLQTEFEKIKREDDREKTEREAREKTEREAREKTEKEAEEKVVLVKKLLEECYNTLSLDMFLRNNRAIELKNEITMMELKLTNAISMDSGELEEAIFWAQVCRRAYAMFSKSSTEFIEEYNVLLSKHTESPNSDNRDVYSKVELEILRFAAYKMLMDEENTSTDLLRTTRSILSTQNNSEHGEFLDEMDIFLARMDAVDKERIEQKRIEQERIEQARNIKLPKSIE